MCTLMQRMCSLLPHFPHISVYIVPINDSWEKGAKYEQENTLPFVGWPRSQVARMKIVSGAAAAGLEEANADVNKRW